MTSITPAARVRRARCVLAGGHFWRVSGECSQCGKRNPVDADYPPRTPKPQRARKRASAPYWSDARESYRSQRGGVS